MQVLNMKEMQQVFGGEITNNSDGSQTTNNANDCGDLYNSGTIGGHAGYVKCVADVLLDGSHTTKPKN